MLTIEIWKDCWNRFTFIVKIFSLCMVSGFVWMCICFFIFYSMYKKEQLRVDCLFHFNFFFIIITYFDDNDDDDDDKKQIKEKQCELFLFKKKEKKKQNRWLTCTAVNRTMYATKIACSQTFFGGMVIV